MTTVQTGWFDRGDLDAWLRDRGHDAFADRIGERCHARLRRHDNHELATWRETLAALPDPAERSLDCRGGVRVIGPGVDPERLREQLMRFHPWRKGPLEFLGLTIDTEWRSDWKWDRFCDAVDWAGKAVLDVGCGNGYYGWRMLAAGAERVVGLDPIIRYLMQFEVFNRYAPRPRRHDVLPLVDTDLPEKLALFDVVVSAGVLYHRTSPIDHLRSLSAALKKGGTLVLETLIVEDGEPTVLVPEDRYARMRNVWFLPSVPMIQRWLRRTGFAEIEVVDITATTTDEQRTTEWMTFQSLSDFLDPGDSSRTVEGDPAPVRAVVTATRNR
jgi:tRNA (mo5U34)-methyltransferase